MKRMHQIRQRFKALIAHAIVRPDRLPSPIEFVTGLLVAACLLVVTPLTSLAQVHTAQAASGRVAQTRVPISAFEPATTRKDPATAFVQR